MSRVIAICNQKGGVAKTVTAVNLAVGLARFQNSASVCLIDMDPQANATSHFGFTPKDIEKSIYDLLIMRSTKLDELAVRGALKESFGVKVLPSSISLAKAEKAIDMAKERRLAAIIPYLEQSIIIIDCPPSLSFHFINALTAATDLIIPIEPEPFALEGVAQLVETIKDIQAELNPDLRVLGVLPTKVQGNTKLHDGVMHDIIKLFGGDVFASYIRRNVEIAESTATKRPIYDHAPKSIGAEDYANFVAEVLRRLN